ncbi:unnamed protein product [Mycena citricolor]|uniref:Uncharacterized protein n=1 Tax=Mycena citricolor TaxID=2018698 RepID=A0AAD2GUQ8_9AGAR|nr:unnamed protein product [Mycena citricolor]
MQTSPTSRTANNGIMDVQLTTVHLAEVRQLGESVCVAEGDEVDGVVHIDAERVLDRGFLPSAKTGRGDERAGVLAREGASGPQIAGVVPERLIRKHDISSSRHGDRSAAAG